eukprot:gnl/Spiro4/24028_TR11904_c0_g1_i1.p1 gnl/Spiro4/24028_TR11904_c0_g1~~gnl/Spiro4/24028_TR11904_c0_g1_i1.p1  ORF type:complete len:112 (-),score=11.39 gnl/Spiro4/24028_TR11904_c0_g1_i1:101-406(-)
MDVVLRFSSDCLCRCYHECSCNQGLSPAKKLRARVAELAAERNLKWSVTARCTGYHSGRQTVVVVVNGDVVRELEYIHAQCEVDTADVNRTAEQIVAICSG